MTAYAINKMSQNNHFSTDINYCDHDMLVQLIPGLQKIKLSAVKRHTHVPEDSTVTEPVETLREVYALSHG